MKTLSSCASRAFVSLFSLFSLFLVFLGSGALGQVPEYVSFQGKLEDTNGPVTDVLDLTFKLYDESNTMIWSATKTNVAVTSGVFSVELGPLSDLTFEEGYSVGVTVEGEPEMVPKVSILSAPYALSMRHVRVYPGDPPSIIAGSYANLKEPTVDGVTISGGGRFDVGAIGDNSCAPDIHRGNFGGGWFATIGGGSGNYACRSATVGGGIGNEASGIRSTISGGNDQTASGDNSTIGGGALNLAEAGYATIGGGEDNQAESGYSFIGGGEDNITRGDPYSVISGGELNRAYATHSVVPGGGENVANGAYGFAAGWRARVNHEGSFVWSDRSRTALEDTFHTSNDNQFLIRAEGGVGIGTTDPDEQLHIRRLTARSVIKLGGDGTDGPHGIIFDDDTPSGGLSLFYRTTPNQLIIERSSSGSGVNSDDAFVYDRDDETFALIRHTEAANHQLEIRNVGGITAPNYSGIRFTQDFSSSINTLANIKVYYQNNGDADMSLGVRGQPDLVFLTDNGRVGIGTTSPSEKLEVQGNVVADNVSLSSDRKLKRNIEPLENALAIVDQLEGVSYEWRADEFPDRGFDSRRHMGFIAQDVERLLPGTVKRRADGTLTLHYQEIIPLLLEAVKELSQKLESSEAESRYLGERLDEQASLISELSSRIQTVETALSH